MNIRPRRMKKSLLLWAGLLFLSGRAAGQAILKDDGRFYPKTDAVQWLAYRPGEIYPIKLGRTGCPEIEVKIDGQPFRLTFDFGSSGGMMVTTAIESRIKYELVRDLTTSNPDGSPRGRGKEILLGRVDVLGKTFERVKSDLYDWKIYSSLPFDGLISLEFFENTRFTLDYQGKKLAISDQPFPEALMKSDEVFVVPLLPSPQWNRYGLYFAASVAGRDAVIYVDSGSSRSFIDRSLVEGKSVSKVGNNDVCLATIPLAVGGLNLEISRIRVSDIRRNTNYQHPVGMVIGSDLLKNFVISVDRTPGRNTLIIHR